MGSSGVIPDATPRMSLGGEKCYTKAETAAYCIGCISTAVLRGVGRQMERGFPGEGVVTTDPLLFLSSFAYILLSATGHPAINTVTPNDPVFDSTLSIPHLLAQTYGLVCQFVALR